MALYHAYSQTVADGTATSVVRPSDWNSGHNQLVTLAGNTAGSSTISGTNIVYQGGNNVTLSGTGSTIVFVGATQTVQTQASGNIAGAGYTSTTQGGSTVGVTLNSAGLSGAWPGFITTYAAQTVDTNKAGTGFTSTTTAGTAITAALGTNGLTMAVPAYITTYDSQTVQTQASGNIAGTGFTSTTTAGTAITAALGTNGLTMAVPAYLTTYASQTVQTQASGNIAGNGYTSTTQAGTTVGLTNGTAGLSVAWPPFITAATGGGGGYTVGFSASDGSSSFSTLTFSNQANDVTFINSGGQVALSHSLQPLSNTTKFAGTGTTFAGTNIAGTIAQNSNGIALSLNNADAHFTGWSLNGNTAGTNSTGLTTVAPLYLSAGNNITLSGNSNTIVIQGAAAGGGTTLSAWANQLYVVNTTAVAPRQNSSNVAPAFINNPVSFDHMRFPITVSIGSTTVATTANTTFSYGVFYTVNVGFYTSSGTNATSLRSALTTSAGMTHQVSVQANTAGSQYTVTYAATFPSALGSTSFSTSYAASTSNLSLVSTVMSDFNGVKHFEIAMASSLPPNMYWVAFGVNSTTATAGVAGLSAGLLSFSNWALSQANNVVGMFGQSNVNTIQLISGNGLITTAGTAGGTNLAGFGFSNIISQASNPVPYIYMEYDG